MKIDWKHPHPVFLDFETQSLADIRKVGGRAYVAHPSTRVMCCSFAQGEKRSVWVPDGITPHKLQPKYGRYETIRGELPSWVLEAVRDGAPLCGHNALEFDRLVWDKCIGVEAAWRDTLPACRSASLPGGLEAACQRLFGVGKNPRGRILEVLCQAQVRGGAVQYPIGLSAAWDDLLTYCTDDDELLERLHSAVIGYAEEDVVEVHQVVNDRGIPIDVAFAARLALLQDELSVKSGLTMSSITEGDLEMHDARSAVKVKKWLLANGVTLPQREGRDSLDRRDVKRMLDDPEEFCDGTEESAALACAVLKLRQEVVRVTSGKAIRMIEAAGEDGRARGQFVYHGAHTGRWSARQVQPHNFPRGLEDIDHSLARFDLKLCEVEAEAERLQVEARKTTPGARVSAGDVLATLLRPVIDGPLCIGDYGAVEARGVNWVADEKRSLALFSDPEADVYVDLARKVFGKQDISKGERWHAKQAELGCGYGMSHRKFRGMVEALGVTMPDGVSAEHIIKTYRAQHQGVVRGWKELEAAVLGAAEGRDTTACRASFYRDGPSVVMKLPSGRRLVYRDARVEQRVPMYCALLGLPPEKKPTFVYRHPYGWEGTLYGGRIMENLVQALCRDLLADALIRAERAGMKPCMHVHDELVAEMDDPRALAELMSTPPAWADGFPVLVEAFFAPRYFKKAGKDSVVSKMLNGR